MIEFSNSCKFCKERIRFCISEEITKTNCNAVWQQKERKMREFAEKHKRCAPKENIMTEELQDRFFARAIANKEFAIKALKRAVAIHKDEDMQISFMQNLLEEDDKLISVTELAELTGLTRGSLQAKIRRGQLPEGTRRGRERMLPREECLAILSSKSTAPSVDTEDSGFNLDALLS